MPTALSVFVFLVGVAFGSFFNALVWRYRRRERITAKHSVCVHCRHALSAADLVPLVSYCLLRGRCRYCHKPIPWTYPVVEAVTGLVVLAPLAVFGLTAAFFAVAVFSLFLEALFLLDLRYSILPDEITIPAFLVGILVALTLGRGFGEAAFGAILGGGFFGLQYLFSQGRWIGGGDIRLGAVLGLALGLKLVLLTLFIAYCVGAIVAVFLLVRRTKGWKSHLPFGTFLTASAYVVLLSSTAAGSWISDLFASHLLFLA